MAIACEEDLNEMLGVGSTHHSRASRGLQLHEYRAMPGQTTSQHTSRHIFPRSPMIARREVRCPVKHIARSHS